jgi:hypothetical protein
VVEYADIVAAVRAELEVTTEGPDWIAGRPRGSSRVIKIRRREVNGKPWVQLLVAVVPAKSARLFAVLQDSAARVVGAPAIDERTLVLREALSLGAASVGGVLQLAQVLCGEAERLAARLAAPADETSELAGNYAE